MNKKDLIFIVEDDMFYGNVLKSFFELRGYSEIEVYTTGEDCLNNIYKCPKLVLLDYNLGTTEGKDILKNIMGFNPNIPVIIVSGQESIQNAIDLLKFGAFEYIQKGDEVFEKLEKIISVVELTNNEVKNESSNLRINKVIAFSTLFIIVALTTFLMLKM